MDKRVIWLCVLGGSTLGGLIPAVWGDSALGGVSLLFGVLGGFAGLWIGVRLAS
jgi:uncharacterized membrane protein